MNTPLVRVVVTDSNVLVNLMHVSRLGLLGRIPGHEFVVPDHVHEEIRDEGQRQRLDSAIADGWLRKESITDIDALAVFADLIQHIGRGEAACIAIAAKAEGGCLWGLPEMGGKGARNQQHGPFATTLDRRRGYTRAGRR